MVPSQANDPESTSVEEDTPKLRATDYYWDIYPEERKLALTPPVASLSLHTPQIEFKIRDTEPKIYRQRISKEDLDSRIALLRERYHNRPEILRRRIAALMKQYTRSSC